MIPDNVKIGHLAVPVKMVEELRDHDDEKLMGRFIGQPSKIEIDEELEEEEKFETFLHEVLEGINSIFHLDMPHKNIQIASIGLAQALEGFEYRGADLLLDTIGAEEAI
jgi:hypothetical protein